MVGGTNSEGDRWQTYLHGTHQLGAFTDAVLDVTPLLIGDGRVLRRALVGHQDPEHIPNDPEAT